MVVLLPRLHRKLLNLQQKAVDAGAFDLPEVGTEWEGWDNLKIEEASMWDEFTMAVGDAWNSAATAGGSMWNNLTDSIGPVWNGFTDSLGSAWESVATWRRRYVGQCHRNDWRGLE